MATRHSKSPRPAKPEKLVKPSLPEKLAGKLEKAARKQEEAAEKLQRAADQVNALDVWTRSMPGARRPRFTRDDIAQAAIRIADTEGFAAVSMRRIAAELDAGTMTLYHYVRTKDELLTLLTDAVMGEVVVPDSVGIPENWREAIVLVAERSRAAFLQHPWILDIADDPPIGPNSVRHFDQSLQAVASLDLELTDKFDIVSTVDEYTFGYCLQERNNFDPPGGAHDTEMLGYVKDLLTTGHYPQLEEIASKYGLEEAWEKIAQHLRDPARFRRNLDRLLDGIEASLGRGESR